MKSYLTTFILLIIFMGNALSQTFVHPGGLHTLEDLNRMKEKVAAGESPWVEGWNTLVSDWKSSSTYGISGGVLANANQRQNMNRDGQAAYLNALRWYISGDVAHAEKAISIYNAYANTVNQIPSGGNTDILGLGGIGFTALAMGAEIMRLYEGWAPEDFEKFKFMMKEYFYPVSHDFLTNHNGRCPTYYWANWDLNNISALIAIGILVDDQDIFNEGIEYFKNGIGAGSIKNAVPFVQGNFGQWQESGRDQSHGLLGIGLMANTCQMAWNQGVDLYGYDDNRFLKGAEYVARTGALSLEAPFFEEYNSCNNRRHRWVAINALGRYFDQPVWEIVYNHYVVKQGLEAPHVKAMALNMRLSQSSNDQLGHGTLTFTLDSDQSPLDFVAPPGQLDGLFANEGMGRVYLRWNAPEGMDAKGYTIKRSTTPGGPYVEISSGSGSTNPRYTDSNVENGTTYYYVVSANNRAGHGPDSEEVSATPVEGGEILPIGWTRADIGNLSIEGEAVYAEVNTGHTFITTGAGSVGGTSDALGFTYGIASGDVTLTARVADFGGLQKTGIMIRESLDPDAKTVLMKIGDAGWRVAEMGVRTGTGTSMQWIGGNRYTWRPEIWFRISRTGNTFTVYESNNKDVWFEVGSRTIEMGTEVYVGLFNSSGNTTSLNTTRYEHVSITGLDGGVPEAPSNLSASSGNTQIELDWDEVIGASSYTLKRSVAIGDPYEVLATNLNITQYTDKGLENGKTYYYVVSSSSLSGESSDSEEIAAAPQIDIALAPEEVIAKSISGQQINLSWNESISATSYHVKRATESGGPYTNIVSADTTSFSDTDVNYPTTYYYVVSAINELGESEDSEEVRATPGQLAYWEFDEMQGTMAADSWGNNDATLGSSASFTTGLINNGVKLSGSDGYVTLPEGLVSHLTDFSISTWVKLDQIANWSRVFDFGSGRDSFMFLTPSNGANGNLRYGINNGAGEQLVNISSRLETDRWHHLALTQSGTIAILYLDGVEVGRNENMTLNPSSLGFTTQNWIGKSQWPDPLLVGNVDDFKIYSKPLSVSEINDIVSGYLPPVAPKNLSFVPGNNQITVSWNDSDGDSYNVKRATGIEGPFELIANVTDTTYTDTDVVNCVDYFYTVSTVNSIGESEDSRPSSPLFGMKLTGLLIGTNGSWGNNPATTKAAAVDGDLGSFFDAPTSTAWVGYDLGVDGMSVIKTIRYAPRPNGYNVRMQGGLFQGANSPDFSDADTLFTVTSAPATGVYTDQVISSEKGYRYVRYLSPNGSGNVSEIEFWGLPAILPEFSGENVMEGTFDSEFHYPIEALNMTKEFEVTGLPEGLNIDNCTGIISGIPSMTGVFPVVITATNYYGSTTDEFELTIKKDQIISFDSIPATYIGSADFTLTAVASSGLPVTFSSSDTTVATIVDGNKLHINALGTSVITASQVGDSLHHPAMDVDQSFLSIPLNISVLHRDGGNNNTASQSIKPHLKIVNESGVNLAMNELTVRYWITPENFAGINTWVDYAEMGKENIDMEYIPLDQPHQDAFGYVEYRFDSSQDTLLAGSSSGVIQSRLNNQDWSDMDETNDHSYKPSLSFEENEHISMYRNGHLVWGIEPEKVDPETDLQVYANHKKGKKHIGLTLEIANKGNIPVNYGELKFRYWFTKEGSGDMVDAIDYVELGSGNLSGQFIAMDPVANQADHYFELGFDPVLGAFHPLSQTGEIQLRLYDSNWSVLDQSNDHSYMGNNQLELNDHITVYYQGQLVFGVEPIGNVALTVSEQTTYTIYPNPLQDVLHIESSQIPQGAVEILIYNNNGEVKVAMEMDAQHIEVDVSRLGKGIYVLTIQDQEQVLTKKLIK
ncbi:cellulose binding domain-containing protein [Belliella marina]|uniref:Cellulose binding domain-containing protein n=1 Tax=Belliella marina TaxID=1644146 RepID=A0ABW4VK98_9BACT